MEDAVYVEKVLDAELARTVILKDIPSSSIFFFLEPQYDSHESSHMLKSFDRRTMQTYGGELLNSSANPADQIVTALEAFIPAIRLRLESLIEELGDPEAINEDIIWDVANEVTSQLGLRARSELMTPLRHALTGRKVSFGLTWYEGANEIRKDQVSLLSW